MLPLCHYPSGVDRGDAARYWWTTSDYWDNTADYGETTPDYWENTPGYSGKSKDIWCCLCLPLSVLILFIFNSCGQQFTSNNSHEQNRVLERFFFKCTRKLNV